MEHLSSGGKHERKGVILKHETHLKVEEGAPYWVNDISAETVEAFLKLVDKKRRRFIAGDLWPCLLATISVARPSPIHVDVLVPEVDHGGDPIGFYVDTGAFKVHGRPLEGEIYFSTPDKADLTVGTEWRSLVLRVSRERFGMRVTLCWGWLNYQANEIVDISAGKIEMVAKIGKIPGMEDFGMLLGYHRPFTQDAGLVLYFAARAGPQLSDFLKDVGEE